MKIVLDSSVAVKWVLPEIHSDKAIRLRDDFCAGISELVSPDIFSAEVAHALTRAERQGRIVVSEAGKLLRTILRTLPDLSPILSLLPRATDISSAARIGVYDCLYVALAEQECCDLITADDKLVKNLQAQFPFIISLASLP